MKTKVELLVDLKVLEVGHSRAVKVAEMSDIFGVGVNPGVVAAWLKKIGLLDIEVTEGDGTTYVFKRR